MQGFVGGSFHFDAVLECRVCSASRVDFRVFRAVFGKTAAGYRCLGSTFQVQPAVAVFVRCDRRGQFKRCRLVQRFIFHRADAGIAVAVAVQVIALHSAVVRVDAVRGVIVHGGRFVAVRGIRGLADPQLPLGVNAVDPVCVDMVPAVQISLAVRVALHAVARIVQNTAMADFHRACALYVQAGEGVGSGVPVCRQEIGGVVAVVLHLAAGQGHNAVRAHICARPAVAPEEAVFRAGGAVGFGDVKAGGFVPHKRAGRCLHMGTGGTGQPTAAKAL